MNRKHLPLPDDWISPVTGYCDWLKGQRQSAGTIKLRNYHLRRLAHLTGLAPFEITPEDISIVLGRDEWSKETARSYNGTFTGFYEWLVTSGRLDADPTKNLPSISSVIGRPRPASESDVRYALDRSNDRVRLMLLLGAYQGLRCREIALVHTAHLTDGVDGPYLLVNGKGDKLRTIPVLPEIASEIRRRPEGWLFPGLINGHLSAAYVSKLISWALPDGVTAHMLRHRFASKAYIATGHDIRAVQELLGHSSVQTTQIYTAIPNGALRAAVDGIRT
ncbi:tyrosine-type recombinase/integrase [Brevibacterium sediminis]|uniref:tyrosine-type recombinase/integrase n=1 Tax=Brevibacterium sediminis TaxID=1857024 RepID=UPI003B3AC27B